MRISSSFSFCPPGLVFQPLFFCLTSLGRILNRFSKDMAFVDDMMPFTVCDFLQVR